MPGPRPVARTGGDPLVIAVRVRPGAARTAVGGRYEGRLGPALVVAVPAPAADGRANAATLRALADALRLRPADLLLRTGATARDKLIEVTAAPADLAQRVRRLRDGT